MRGSDALDKQILANIKKVSVGVAIYFAVVTLVLLIIQKLTFSTEVGLLVGCLVSLMALFSIARGMVAFVEKDTGKATFSAVFGYFSRFLIYAIVLVFAGKTGYINVFTVALGLISVSLVIKAQEIFSKLKK